MPYRKGLRHYLYIRRGHGRPHTLKLGWVEEISRWQESSCWTCHPNYYQEHPPHWLEDDDRRRYHLELRMCVWLYDYIYLVELLYMCGCKTT